MTLKGIVIDADVARAAGDRPIADRASAACRLFLAEQRLQGVGVVMTSAVWAEWNVHASSFARQWLAAMASRGLVLRPRARVVKCMPTISRLVSQGVLALIEKDLLLIEAANASDQLVCSRDRRARRAFGQVACSAKEIGNVVWVDPCNVGDEPLAWLQEHAPWSRARALCVTGD